MKRLMDNISALQAVFQRIHSLMNGPDSAKWITSKLLDDSISELEREFNRLLQVLNAGAGKKHKFVLWDLRRLKWPLQKKDMEKTLQLLEQHKSSLIVAFGCDQM